ncbi:ABC transporter substrate-binding protein [Propionibacteriaceae bacterium Y2011]
MSERRRVTWQALVGALLIMVLTACETGRPPVPPPSATEVPRAFTVGTTDAITATDPAAITDAASSTVAYNVFQRLTTVAPDSQAAKVDAARECKFDAPTVYVCTLLEGLVFHNGHALTSSDVQFSIERALRLDVAGTSTSLLSSLRRIETPDPLTVRFILSRVDTQFVWGLASPAASIVDEELYDPDAIRPVGESIIGSGPFRVSFHDPEQLQLARNPTYKGRSGAGVDGLVLRHFATSAELESAMLEHDVDVVWRGLGAAAVTRLQRQVEASDQDLTETGFAQVVLPGARVHQLMWRPESPNRQNEALRKVVAFALQEDRISESLLPDGIPGRVPTFPVGVTGATPSPSPQRIQLSLAYDPTAPDAADRANQLRSRLENTGLSVRLVQATPARTAEADLLLLDRKAWTSAAIAWLQPYLDDPVQPGPVTTELNKVRSSADPAVVDPALAAIQEYAAEDLVVLPMTQTDEVVFVAQGWLMDPTLLAPGHQLALWGLRRA